MRIQIVFQSDGTTVPYSHQHLLTGTIHKWLGQNSLHGHMALHSFSRLEGAQAGKDGLRFDKKGSFFFSAHHPAIATQLISGIMRDRNMFCGLSVDEVGLQQDPDFSGINNFCFRVASPILVKRPVDKKTVHFLYSDPQTDLLLKETLLHKMKLAGIDDDSLTVEFNRTQTDASTKLVDYDGIKNKANWCSVRIAAKPETLLFVWNVGLGNSTGIGFGAVR